jgi:ribosomal protein S11
MDHGEINLSGAKLLANSLKNKKMLKICDLNGNQFGRRMSGAQGYLRWLR